MIHRQLLTAAIGVILYYPLVGLGDSTALDDSSVSCASLGLPADDQQHGECRIVVSPTPPYEDDEEHHDDHGHDERRTSTTRTSNNGGYASTPHVDLTYDLYNCPRQPSAGYPVHWNAPDVLQNWPIYQTNVPPRVHQGLCVLNYTTPDDQTIAMNYLNAEVPFVLRNLADIDETARQWQQAGYLEQLFGRKRNKHGQIINSTTISTALDDDTVPLFLVHKSPNYKFMYWKLEDGETYTDENAWLPPTEMLRMSFADYRKLTQKTQHSNNLKVDDDDDDDDEKDEAHYYLYADGFWNRKDNDDDDDSINNNDNQDSQLHRWHLFHELPRFQVFDDDDLSSQQRPPPLPDVFQELVNGETFQKMLCKIGTRGNHAAMHFDQGRNTIVVLTGRRRYLLAHPSTCSQWNLFNIPHPSFRHSMLDFENIAASSWNQTTTPSLLMNEVILEPGDVLILPSYWFHSVVLLEDDSAQCNGWSTATRTYRNVIESCGSFLHQ
jgi:Cupin-like domain